MLFGTFLTLLGTALAIWARIHLGRNWSAAPALKENHELITSGPYQRLRHPIYTGLLIAALGSTLVTSGWLLALLIMSITFTRRVHIEEKLMLQQFPEQYPSYQKRTWALLPYIW